MGSSTQRAQENVRDYPRPPRLEACGDEIRVEWNGKVVARSTRAYRILETYHPPTYYIPMADVDAALLRPSSRASFCEWKGRAAYYDLVDGGAVVADACWTYPAPSAAFGAVKDALCFYPSRVDACYVAGERVEAQPGDFYGGWVTSWITGPIKGAPGTRFW